MESGNRETMGINSWAEFTYFANTVFAAHVLAKIKIFDEITEKSKFNYLS